MPTAKIASTTSTWTTPNSTPRVNQPLAVAASGSCQVRSPRTIGHCFTGREFGRIDHDRRPGWARAYAAVLADGEVAPGDDAVLEPPDQRNGAPGPANGRRAG